MHSRSDAPGLHWHIKHRFLQYIARMPDGECSVTDGAQIDEAELFHFTFEHLAGSPAAPPWTATCRGEVRFAGHHGFLFVRIADPIVRIDGGAGQLSILTHGEGDGDEQSGADGVRIDMASFDVAPGPAEHVLMGRNVRLNPEAVDLFNDVYPADEPLDDFNLLLPTTTKETR